MIINDKQIKSLFGQQLTIIRCSEHSTSTENKEKQLTHQIEIR